MLKFVSLCAALVLLTAQAAWAGETRNHTILAINTVHLPPLSNADGSGFQLEIAREMFRRIGVAITFNFLPAERGLWNANSGVDDGLATRVGGLSKKYTNLVQFEEKLFDFDFVAFTRNPNVQINGWASFERYSVAIINGWKIFEANIKKTRSLTKVGDSRQLFDMLMADRVDVIAYSKIPGLQFIKENGLQGIRVLAPNLASLPVYFYLHNRHVGLAVKASRELRQMKVDGSYQRIYDATLGGLLN